MDKIILCDLAVQGVIGIYDWERQAPQEIRINLELGTDLQPAGTADDFSQCVDYAELAARVSRLVETSHCYTLEALAERIACLCLEDSRLEWVRVRVEKPAAIPVARSAGVEIERTRCQS